MTATTPSAIVYVTRPALPDEMPLVLSTWIRTLRADVHARHSDAERVRPDDYYAGERARAEWLITAHGVSVATLTEVPDEVLGWACTEPGALHYGHVKHAYRGAGVMRALLAAASLLPGAFRVSTLTRGVLAWMRNGRPVTYDPYLG